LSKCVSRFKTLSKEEESIPFGMGSSALRGTALSPQGQEACREQVPEVSVFVPVFNAGQWISAMLASVLAQSFSDWGLWILDDGSTDDTAQQVRPFLADGRIRYCPDSVNRGLVFRLNQSVAMCKSPFYARMDAEDVMHPARLAVALAALKAHPDAPFCASAACVVDAQGRLLGVRVCERPTAFEALTRGAVVHPTVVARTAFLRENPYSDGFLRAEDREFFLRDRLWERGVYLALPLLFYRYLSEGKTGALLRGYASERRLIWAYGPSLVGWRRCVWALGRSWLKTGYVGLRGPNHSGLLRGLSQAPLLMGYAQEGWKALGGVSVHKSIDEEESIHE
jgi:glycosyltransferase involved in cell wall biosynthesis